MKRSYKQNSIDSLQAMSAPIWKKVAKELSRPTRNLATVSVGKLEKYSKEGFTVVVPGKLVSNGAVTQKLSVAAFGCSDAAKMKIEAAGGKVVPLMSFAEKSDGKKVVLVK
ncbi:MAG: 50S ribosomal protein L18e [Candidatus Woesearchaeota archaeon]